jgi:bile acid:Na+ symporter, BASS family
MSVEKLFNDLFGAGLVTMLITLVASLGMTFSVHQILAPVRQVWLLLATIAVNAALAPLIAIGICHALPLSKEAAIGVELVTIAAIGPAALKACQLAKRADMPMAVSYTIVLGVLNIIVAPLWAKVIVKGATVSVLHILGNLVLIVLLPLVVGAILRARYPAHAPGWKTGLEKISNIALYIAIAAGLAVNWKTVVHTLGSWVIVASVLIILAYIALGWVAGIWKDQQSGITISMLSSLRFTPVGLFVIATVLKNQSAYLAPALIFCLLDTFIPFGAGAEIGRHVSRAEAKPAPAIAPSKSTGSVPAGAGARTAT